jgi:serine/threonine protein kinase/tetratricopeptide (TPR) repeat protein
MSRRSQSLDLDAGPDQGLAVLLEQVTARLQAGEPVDADELAAAHPEHAERLRQLLPSLRLLADASQHGLNGLSPSAALTGLADDLSGEPLGDFRLLREVGRGGMGVVYEAEQRSLRRRVALKVLPWAAALDPKQLQRFKNEALAAASLKHEHIVHVYGVGCERGVHYYAMEYVEGQTLAQLIHALHTLAPAPDQTPAPLVGGGESTADADGPCPPNADARTSPAAALSTEKSGPRGRAFYRMAAELIAQAADALEHAHGLGIVHRDVKPGNLLLGSAGKVYVSDFGLARFGPDAGLTMSGDVLGTLRYMAPEQALARHGLVDHRADVYALGATLYELLTGRPAVNATERAEILRKIAFEEPVAPRKLDKAIPAELETITLKCLAKSPAERYATAGELADDLRRWLGDQTIKAKPPGVPAKVAKWARRHVAAVWAIAAVSAVASAALALSTWLIWKKEGTVRTALESETRERRRAQANLQIARDAVEQMLTHLSEKHLARVPQMEMVRARVLQDALLFHQRLLQEQGDDPAVRAQTAFAHMNVGWIQRRLGRQDDAVTSYRDSIRTFEDLAAADPDEPEYRRGLAEALDGLGGVLNSSGRGAEAETRYRQALELQEKLVADFPGVPTYRAAVAWTCNGLGNRFNDANRFAEAAHHFGREVALREQLLNENSERVGNHEDLAIALSNLAGALANAGQRMEAEAPYKKALATQKTVVAKSAYPFQNRPILAHILYELGTLFLETDRPAEAEKMFQEALPVAEEVAKDFPDAPDDRDRLARLHNARGNLLKQQGRPTDADVAYRQALTIQEKLADDFPGRPEYRRTLARTLNNRGFLLKQLDRIADAERSLRQAVAAAEQVAKAYPSNRDYRSDEADYRNSLGSVLMACNGRDAEAERVLREALAIQESLVKEAPDNAKYRHLLGGIQNNLAMVLNRQRKFAPARALLEQAVIHQQAALKVDAGNKSYRQFLRNHYDNLAETLEQLGEHAPAVATCRKALELDPNYVKVLNNLAWLLATCPDKAVRDPAEAVKLAKKAVEVAPRHADHLNTLGVALYQAGNWQEAVDVLDKSVAKRKGGDSYDFFFLAMAHWQLGRREDAGQWYGRAVEWMDKNRPNDEDLRRFRAEAAAALPGIADAPKPPTGPRPDP